MQNNDALAKKANGTKQQLADAMSDLLKKNHVESISVTMISQKAGISRQTFYRYFLDIYDLIEWIYLNDKSIGLNFYDRSGDFETALHINLLIMHKNKEFYVNTRTIKGGSFYLDICYQRSVNNFVRYLSKYHKLTRDLKFSVEFFSAAYAYTLFVWIKNDMKTSPDELADSIYMNMSKDLKDAINITSLL